VRSYWAYNVISRFKEFAFQIQPLYRYDAALCEERGAGDRLWIAVEGGVSRRTAAEFTALGANALVVGKALFDAEGVDGKRDAIEAMTPKGQPVFVASKSFFATPSVSGDESGRNNITGS
jgi:hypothetical protein